MAPGFVQRLFADSLSVKDVVSSKHPGGQERYGFWSPELKDARRSWLKLVLGTFLAVTVVMFAMLSVYFGSYYEQVPRADWYSVEVLDLDSVASPYGSVQHPAILGPAMQRAISTSKQSQPHLGWFFTDDNTLQQFRIEENGRGVVPYEYAVQRVLNQDVWAVLIINANATSGAWSAVESGSSWNPIGAMTFLYEDARNFNGNEQYVARLGPAVMLQGAEAASNEFALQVLQLGNGNILASAPQDTVAGAFRYNLHNLRPFDMLAGIPATTVGTIYLIIFTFLISVLWNNQGLPLIQNSLRLPSEVLIKVFVPFVAYFWLSLHYSLVSYAFHVRFDRYFGNGGFVLYWMASWITMNALGFVMETVFLWAGPFFPFFLVFWVILNVSVAFLSISNMSPFYRYGYILPVWNLVDASKCIIFATKNHLVQNFAVNLGWMVVWMILLAVTVIVQRRRKDRAALQEKWREIKDRDARITEKEARERGDLREEPSRTE